MKYFPLLFLFIFLVGFGCITETEHEKDENENINVIVSFYPIYEFTKNVAGEEVNVEILIPPNVEPHEYEIKPSDMVKIIESSLFIYNGAGMEPWVHNLIKENEVEVLDLSENINLIRTNEHHGEEGGHTHGEYDPHIWLSPLNVIKQVESIRDKLIEINPQNEGTYNRNAEEYIIKLKELDEKIKSEINNEKCKKSEIVITHASLGYFARDYGFNQIALSGVIPQSEVSVQQLTKIMEEIESKNVKVIFTEEQVNPQTAEIIANELGIQLMTFNTIHGESEEGKDYITLMEDNISRLKVALECE